MRTLLIWLFSFSLLASPVYVVDVDIATASVVSSYGPIEDTDVRSNSNLEIRMTFATQELADAVTQQQIDDAIAQVALDKQNITLVKEVDIQMIKAIVKTMAQYHGKTIAEIRDDIKANY